MRKYFVVVLLVLAGLFSWAAAPVPEHTQQGFAMNTLIRMTVNSNDENLLNRAFELLNRLDNELSMYNPSSDLAAVNALAGKEKYFAPSEVIEAVRGAARVHDITEGVFNPLIGAVTRLWKINQNDGTVPTHEELQAALSLTGIENLEVTDKYIFLKREGSVLDLGGLAKGYASDRLAQFFRDNGVKSGLIDLGGNVYVVGTKQDGSNWRIGIRDPLNPRGRPALVANVHDTAVITSGNYERFKVIDGKRYSHFFDPKTGESVNSDLLSVTIITPDGALADGLATAFMITDMDTSKRILQGLPDVGAVFITQYGISATKNLEGTITGMENQNISFF